jgi:hypothetical protein
MTAVKTIISCVPYNFTSAACFALLNSSFAFDSCIVQSCILQLNCVLSFVGDLGGRGELLPLLLPSRFEGKLGSTGDSTGAGEPSLAVCSL